MRKTTLLAGLISMILTATSAPAWACSALIGPRGSVQLGRTTTLAGYWDGREHYVTSFRFSGEGGKFGALVPLPGIPEKVERGGDWTLQRLLREVSPREPVRLASAPSAESRVAPQSAREVQHHKIDALDITVLEGGGAAVGIWAKEHGFLLPPDAPEILDFYARRSPIFMAAVFDGEAAAERGHEIGDGTPVHLTIPTDNPWVPLRILSLGKASDAIVEVDVFLLTPTKPALLPVRGPGIQLLRREPASSSLLADLRSDKGDKGMESLPDDMWLTYLRLDTPAGKLRFDLASDLSGRGKPSWEAAGLPKPVRPTPRPTPETSPSPTPTPPTIDASPSPVLLASKADRPAPWPRFAALALLLTGGTALAVTLIQRRRV